MPRKTRLHPHARAGGRQARSAASVRALAFRHPEARGDSSSSSKPQWLLIKHRDDYASDGDVVAENMTSVDTGRTMEEIALGKKRVWHSNREPKAKRSAVELDGDSPRRPTRNATTTTQQ